MILCVRQCLYVNQSRNEICSSYNTILPLQKTFKLFHSYGLLLRCLYKLFEASNFWVTFSGGTEISQVSLKIHLCFEDGWKSYGFELTWWWVNEVYSTCVLSALSTGVCGQMNFVRRPGRLAAPNRFLPRPRPRPFGLEEKNINQIRLWTHCQEYNHEHQEKSSLWCAFKPLDEVQLVVVHV